MKEMAKCKIHGKQLILRIPDESDTWRAFAACPEYPKKNCKFKKELYEIEGMLVRLPHGGNSGHREAYIHNGDYELR